MVWNVWVGAKGACLEDGSTTTIESVGWYCRCCRYKLRAIPHSIKCKSQLDVTSRTGTDVEWDTYSVDLSHFNWLRAELLQRMATILPESRNDLDGSGDVHLSVDMIRDLQYEFGDIRELLNLAYDINLPNKISLVVEFESVKSNLDTVPTKSQFEKISSLTVGLYDSKFGSWENFLDSWGMTRGTGGTQTW